MELGKIIQNVLFYDLADFLNDCCRTWILVLMPDTSQVARLSIAVVQWSQPGGGGGVAVTDPSSRQADRGRRKDSMLT